MAPAQVGSAAEGTGAAEFLDKYSTIVDYLDTVARAPGGQVIGSPAVQLDPAWRDAWVEALSSRGAILTASPGRTGFRVWHACWRVRDAEGRLVETMVVTLLEQLGEGEVQS